MTDTPTFTANIVAKLLDLTTARVGQLAKEGTIEKAHKGRYKASVIPQYIRWLRNNKKQDENDVSKLIEEEKHRKLKRENDLEEQLIAPVSVLTEALEKVADQIVPILDALPLEMKRLNPKLSGHDIQTVKKAIARARNVIADVSIEIEEKS